MTRIILLIFTSCCFTLLSGMNEISFKHLGVNDGLSNSQINYITKDSQGCVWFSTTYGLNRYDGYTFKVFTRNSKVPYSLPENSIKDVQEDADGGLWVHTLRSGYVYYNSKKETFHPADSLLKRYGIPDSPYLMYIDKEKNIWSYAYNGTHFYNRKEQKLFFYPIEETFKQKSVGLVSFAEDKDGIILFYSNGYFERVDRETNQITLRNDKLVDEVNTIKYKYAMFVDGDGDYWAYGDGGIWTYYTDENRWEYISAQKESPYVLSGSNVIDIKQDAKKQIWVAINEGGINIINKNLRTIQYLQNDVFNERSILQNSINCLYCDDSGGVWVGYYKRGVSYYNESIFKFRTDHLSEFNSVKRFTSDVNMIAEDKNANLWAGSSSGLIFLNRETGERKINQHTTDRNSLSGDVIVSMLKAKDGKIWVGTFRDGLNVFDGKDFFHYRHNPKNPNSLINDNVWALAEGSNGYIWIGTLGSGLQGLDPHTGKFTYYPKPGSGFEYEYINSICIGRDSNVYMATSNGITIFSLSSNKFEKLLTNRKGTQTFSHPNINEVYEDSRGLLWIATSEGLNIYDRKNDEIIIPVYDSPLGTDIIQAIIEDNNKNMWITTTSSISNVIVSTDPRTGVYTYDTYQYGELDGLQGQQFNTRSITKTFRGEIIAGGIQGLSFFDPETLKYNNDTPSIEFTELQLFNQKVKIDSVYSGNRILTQSINHTKEIRLKHQQNVFSVSFSAMSYILPKKTKYMYMLDGFDPSWLTTDINKLTYTNLSPGKYTLKIKAINSDGFSNHETSELRIVIEPPFWASPLAFIVYVIMVIGVLLFARRQILRNERQRFKLVQIEQEAQQKHEIDDMKLRFFTNISHELRTPLTLIISPLENVIKQIENKDQKNKLDMVHRNAIRLLGMVNQLLDFRKSDVKGHQLNAVQGDIVEYIHSVSNYFSEYSEKKNVHSTFFTATKELWMMFDEDKIGKVIMNLLSNAFKFTPEGGRVDVSLNLSLGDENHPELLEIKISDSGIGIDDADKELIFERFYQVQHKEGQKSSGSGIGLHLVKEFVSLHDGTVTVHNNVGKGSVFIVTLPVRRVSPQSCPTTSPAPSPLEKEIETTPSSVETSEQHAGTTILIVDDNQDFRLFMRDCLQAEYTVVEAEDGSKAWDMIPKLQPDIIVSDVMMPEMDGNELCKLVKTDIRTSHIPLILLTARSAKEQKMEGLESGADDYMTKPFDFDILALRIKKLLQLQHKRQESFTPMMEINPSEITITSLDEKLINKAIKYVEDNISRYELSVEELSSELGMSRVHFYKKMVSITGKTPIEFIRIIRLKRAAQYLRESQQNVSEIVYQTGFSNLKYFRKYFKEEFGMLPSEYQEKNGIQSKGSGYL